MPSLREKKTAKKKEEILQSAISLITEKGYHNTTMEDIAAKLLMTKGSVYYYFKDKQDLLYQSYKMLLENSINRFNEVMKYSLPVDEKLRKAMQAHTEYLITQKNGFETGMKPEHFFDGVELLVILDLRSEYATCFDEIITAGIEANLFKEMDIKIVRNLILGALNWVIQWYSPDGNKNKEELAETISNHLMCILIKS
ncbi:TetR/AcrR family transcriptional regulator [Oceanobacillus sp. CF4.6]|uniref:TetR/AcrR family transcriptional regulator n=1 Tax=Oceanobacillus sp. CF4.6 TaxID=3373080 RepID=UPI003EE5D1B8